MKIDFGTVSERDMDVLFLNLFGTDPGFLKLFLNKVNIPKEKYTVNGIYLSKADKDGESDITVIIENQGRKYGLLIEDKIDAIAMPEQPERYAKRGAKGVDNGDYEEFFSFIVCPEKYYKNNDAARRYPYAVMYEDIRDYLKEKTLDSSMLTYYNEICQAIEKAKKPSQTTIDENANRFFRSYKDYQEKKYPQLSLRTSRESNGYWAHYTTRFGSVYLYHKINDGNVDLTFGKASQYMDKLEIVAAWLRKHGIGGVSSVITGKAGALRISVPKLNMQIPFEENDEYNIDICFKTISELIEVANVFEAAKEVSDL